MADMTYGYENLKTGLDRRAAIETRKVQDLKTAFEKIKTQLEAERKSYCVDMKKQLSIYATTHQVETGQFKVVVAELVAKMDELDKVYATTIKHIEGVSISCLAALPKKFETYRKAIKVSDKQPSELHKIKDFEFDRLEHTKLSLCHFINAQMYLHAKALEIFSQVYTALNGINFANEFKEYDNQQVKDVLKEQSIPYSAGKENGNGVRRQ